MKKIISLLLVGALFISSCKDETDRTYKTNVTSVSGSYIITAATYKSNPTSSEENYFDIFFPDTCQKDNVYTFQTNGTYEFKDAGAVCSPAGNRNGIWSVGGNTMVVDGDSTVIERFDCKALVFFSNNIKIKGDKLRVTAVKQQ